MLNLKTYLRACRGKNKDEGIIYFIVANEWISTSIVINKKYWCTKSGSILKLHPQYYTVAPWLQTIKARAEQCIANYQISNEDFNRHYFETFVFKSKEQADNPCLKDLIKEYCNIKSVGLARAKHYSQLQAQICVLITTPKIKDIDATFVDRFKKYLSLKNNAANCENTIIRKIKMLKAIVHFAQQKGILKTDTLISVKLKTIKGNKQHLTIEELKTIEQYYLQKIPASHKQVLKYFLFSCYTGLRYSDVINLRYTDIKNNAVQTVQEKTNKPVLVPLCTQAKELLQINSIGKCFATMQNQPTNRVLKEIMIATGIEKIISYHCSRHTFGTLSITLGIPMEIVAELMGVDFTTVKIYAKIVNKVKQNEMLKWERKVM